MYRSRMLFFMFLSALTLLSVPLMAQDEPYRNPELPVEERVEDLLGRMSLDEKIGQMTLIEKNSIQPAAVTELFIGGILSGGGGYPSPNTPESWAEMVKSYQDAALATPLGIPMIYGVDAVHGHNNVKGATIFPHNIGLGATRNPELVGDIASATAKEMIATGIYWDYAPTIAVVQDIRWGRTYEGYSENTDVVTQLGTAYLQGLQGESLDDPNTVIGTPKHYIGDGGTTFGTSSFGPQNLDRGDTQVDDETLRSLYLPPYIAAVEAGARSIMVSYSSLNGTKMHGRQDMITDVLKGELGFTGFIVSDWAGVDEVNTDFYQAVVISINAGVDMNMVPYDAKKFITAMQEAVEKGDISMERIDDAVRRILRVKFELGLFEEPHSDPALLAEVGSEEHRALAREAVSQSAVLLKNANQALPLAKDAATIFVAGVGADDIGLQSGGWTIEWQGREGNITDGTTILEGIEAAVSADTEVIFNRFGRFEERTDEAGNLLVADIGIVVVSEKPYAEYQGDSATLALTPADKSTIERVRAQSEKLVVILLSGRPMIIDGILGSADAFVAAWLPGTEGNGVTDVLFGDKPFTGKLPYTWPRTIDQIPFDFAALPTEGCEAPLFPFDYGLTAEDSESEWLDLAAECAPAPVEVSTEVEVVTDAAVPVADPIAPNGTFGETYYAPFPVKVTLDGKFDDWAGVPQVSLEQEEAGVSFAAAADAEFLYLYASMTDDNIISGQHEENYWNEDSVEFYINATGDFELSSYTDGVAQITIPALNAGLPADDAVLAGIQGESAETQIFAVKTKTGWSVEAAVPLKSSVWAITPTHEGEIGFNVHLNGASTADRDTKLIWSVFDPSDASYQNPSVFGKLIFFEVGSEMPEATEAEHPDEEVVEVDDSVTWDSREWTLVWSDEFEGEAGTPPNPEFWGYDIGGHGWGNNQLEYNNDRVENVSLDGNGNLAITARKENIEGYRCYYGPCEYTSARILTKDKMEFTYGRVEARIKVPFGQGIWPAFWSLGANFDQVGWPNSGEIDIMEYVGKEPNTTYGTVHGPGYSGASGIGANISFDEPVADDFHVFAVDWDPNVIRWYVDGELFQTLSADELNGRKWVFDHDFFLILNVAVGGYWPGNPDDTTVFPQTMLVDYVRVYELAGE